MTEPLTGIAPANATSLGSGRLSPSARQLPRGDLDQCGKAQHVHRKRKPHPNGPCLLCFAGFRVHSGCHGCHHAAPNRSLVRDQFRSLKPSAGRSASTRIASDARYECPPKDGQIGQRFCSMAHCQRRRRCRRSYKCCALPFIGSLAAPASRFAFTIFCAGHHWNRAAGITGAGRQRHLSFSACSSGTTAKARSSASLSHQQVIRKGKAAKPTEFGKLVKLQEAENRIVIDYEVYAQRPNDSDLLIPTIEVHEAKLGRMPRLVAADAGFCSDKNEAAAKAKGVKRVCIPNRSRKSVACKRMRRTHQCEQATTWSPAVPISW